MFLKFHFAYLRNLIYSSKNFETYDQWAIVSLIV